LDELGIALDVKDGLPEFGEHGVDGLEGETAPYK
jgi:hypothetical protein